jgi:uncharacterized protein YcaQ
MNITQNEAKKLILTCQLLDKKRSFETKADVLKIIRKLGYVQIDTISVAERAHHHILWTRMKDYKRAMLHELLERDKQIFEYWSHAAAFLPIENYRFSLFRKKKFREKYKDWFIKNKKIIKYVKDRITSEGPLRSKDFEHTGEKLTGWWNWKPAKAALESLFMSGELMVCKREGFQKTYDITERILPEGTDTTEPTEEEYSEHLLLSNISNYGLSTIEEASYLKGINKKTFTAVTNKLAEENKILNIKIKGSDNKYYTSKMNLKILSGNNSDGLIHILSPFDNLIIQRKRLKQLFGFDYFLECYLPEAKRKYGYFSMPVLFGDKFIGTIDAKADRKNKEFIIKNRNTETPNKKSEKLLSDKIKQFSDFTLNWC